MTRGPVENPTFLPSQDHLRWGRLKNADAELMYRTVADEVFPFLRGLGAGGSTYIVAVDEDFFE